MKKIINNKLEGLKTTEVLTKLIENQKSLEVNLKSINSSNQVKTIPVNSASKIEFIPMNEIIYCYADLSYTKIISFNKKGIISSKSLKEFETMLNCEFFYRISKSILVNTKQMQSYNKKTGQLTMRDNSILIVSRRKRTDFTSVILK